MGFDVDKRLKVICSLVMLAAIAFMPLAGMSDLQAQEDDTFHLSPLNPDFVKFFEEPPDPFYGYIPPPMDLSHLDEIPVERPQKATSLPGSFDWRDTGKVTSVKNQNPCGTCWVHGTLAALESRVLIEESATYDFSEQNLACCADPAWVYLIGNRCNGGGFASLATDTLTKKGSRLESCDPYNTDTIDTEACDDSCQSIKIVTDFRMIADPATSSEVIVPIKNAIYDHGPLAMSYAADGSYMYPGSIYYWPDCPANEVNHLVCIVGWDDTVAHPVGGGSGAWIVKNSWGTGWGDSGYFYLCYGSAGMCEVASLDYKDYDANETLYYWDEAGQVGAAGCSAPSAWMANIFTSAQDGSLTHVDFWTTSNNAEYDIYVYLDGDISDGLDDLATSQSGTCQEYGYYSIPLSSPVSLTSGQPFTIAVKTTTPGYNYPIPVEQQYVQGETTIAGPTIQSGVSYARCGDTGAWDDVAPNGWNACLRGRVTSEAADCPWLSVSPTSGSVASGDSHNITVSINTTGLGSSYSAEIVIASNDPDEDPLTVPVTLHVGVMVLVSIAAEPSETSLGVAGGRARTDTEQLVVTATYSDESTADVTDQADYESDDENVATVSDTGLITATGEGTATVTVSYTEGEITRTTTVSVTVAFDPSLYDVDESEVIEKNEVLWAIMDYFGGEITKLQVLQVLQLYFTG